VSAAVAPLATELATLRKARTVSALETEYSDVIKASGMDPTRAVAMLEAMDEDGRKEFAKGIRALKAQAAATGIFKSFGSSAAPASDAEAELENLAKVHAEKTGVTFEVAYDTVCKTNAGRELYSKIISGAN
jgi:hypothetical protein